MKSKASKKYWDDHWQKTKFSIAPKHHPIRKWIESEIKQTKNSDVFEIGSYPGKFLAVFGEKGYKLSGIDSFIDKNSSMEKWLRSKNYKVGKLYQQDFWKHLPSQQYDVVCSFGLIEHFDNWDEALKKHIKLTKDNGRIMIDVPNLKSPLYYILYKIFEPQVLSNHVLSVMSVDALKRSFIQKGCTIKTANYVGYFFFRFVTRTDNLSLFIAKVINYLRPVFELLPESVYKRYIVVSAIKNKSCIE